jgi:predicted dehydrogenase
LKQVLIKSGGVVVEDVPAPEVGARNVLVRVAYSCVSVGTEMSGVQSSGQSLYRRALKQPARVAQVVRMAREQGIARTASMVQNKLEQMIPTGYSAAGEIIAVGAEVEELRVGDRVACAGAGIANHAEIIDVPVNLAVKVPDALDLASASTVTLGAIALQGVRRANPTLGETIVVVGLGVLGQITAQLLQANGCRVIGVDLDGERIRLALEQGMDHGVDPATESYVERVSKLTNGFGADAVIVTAATPSHTVVNEAMQACRRKGRVVLVGDVGLHLDRSELYRKELDLFISTSYGPGRYDAQYEEGGVDYPLPYVRWTENRNMEEYLRLLAAGKISLTKLREEPYPVARAPQAYEALKAEGRKPLFVLLEYPRRDEALERKVAVRAVPAARADVIRIGLVGASTFAQNMHLPNLASLRQHFAVQAVMSRTGSNAKSVAIRAQAAYATTDYAQVLADRDIDLVLIATRHDLHASLALEALRAGKHVFVEKPLAIDEAGLGAIEEFYKRGADAPLLMTGFNRRFSPAMQRAKAVLANRTTPILLNYRMNAGYIPLDSWVHGPEGGGRNIGEACHIYDLFSFFTDSEVVSVQAKSIRPDGKQWARNDNFVATVAFADGSVCTLTYTAMGDPSHPKERMEIFADGKVLAMEDFKSLTVAGGRQKGWEGKTQQKGQLQELEALAASLRSGAPWPIPLEHQLRATEISFEVERQIKAES